MGLTRHKMSDREPRKACHAAEGWMAKTQKVGRSAARGSLHRLVRPHRCSYLDQRDLDTGGEVERPANTAIKSKA